MAISNYSELQQAVIDYSHRSTGTIAVKVPTFIALAERRLCNNPRLRVRQMEASAMLSLLQAAQTMALPSDFLEVIDLHLLLDGIPYLVQPADHLAVIDAAAIQSWPCRFRVGNGEIKFNVAAGQSYTVLLRYYATLDLAATNTNWLLAQAPDIYLYASLAELFHFVRGAEAEKQAELYDSRVGSAIEMLARSSDKSRGRAVLDSDVQRQSNYHIISDSWR